MDYKERLKKILTLFLVLTMVFTLIPFNVMVNQAASKKTKKVTLNHSSASLIAGESVKLKVKKVLPAGASKSVVWKTSDKKVATVTGKGVVKAVKAGTAKITAVSKKNAKAKASCKITVYQKTKKIRLNSEKSYVLPVGDSIQLDAEVTSPAKNAQPISWKSGNTQVATVSEDGLVKAVGEGTVKVTAVSGKKSVSVQITVQKENPSAAITYTVTYNTGEGSGIAPQTVESGKAAVKPNDPAREGYVFDGWYKDSSYTSAYDFSAAVTQDTTIYAKWKQAYIVSFDSNGGDVVSGQVVESGKAAVKPSNPTRKGYIFAGWYKDSAFKESYDFAQAVTQDITLYAKWSVMFAGGAYYGGYSIGSGSSSSIGSGTGNSGSGNSKPDMGNGGAGSGTPGTGNGASGSGGDSNGPGTGENTPEQVTYTVVFDTKGGNTLPVQAVQSGKTCVQPDVPSKKGYTFAGWYLDGNYAAAYNFGAAVTQNIILYAKWQKNDITLWASIDELLVNAGSHEAIFHATLSSPDSSISEVSLYNHENTKVATLKDGGRDGDDLPNDGTYSAKVSIPDSVGDYSYYAKLESTGATSNDKTIVVYNGLTNTEIQQMDSADTQIEALMDDTGYQDVPEEQQVQKVGEMLENLGDQDLIVPDSICYDDETKNYSFEYSCGVYGMVAIDEEEQEEETDSASGLSIGGSQLGTEASKAGESSTPQAEVTGDTVQNVPGQESGTPVSEEPAMPEEGTPVSGEPAMPEAGTPVSEEPVMPEAGMPVSGEPAMPEAGMPVSGEPAMPEAVSQGAGMAGTQAGVSQAASTLGAEAEGVQPAGQADEKDEHGYTHEDRINAAGPQNPDSDGVGSSYNQKAAKIAILYSRDDPSSTNPYYQRWVNTYNKLSALDNIEATFNYKVTVEDYRTAFAGKDLVLIHSHGSRMGINNGTSIQYYSVVCLRDQATAQKDNEYKEDLKRRRLVKVFSGGKQYYWVCPSFFSYYYNDDNDNNEGRKINHAIVYMGMCLGFGEGQGNMVDYTLGAELKKAGAASVLGYYNSVYTNYNLAMAESILDDLLDEQTIGTAVDNAKANIGEDDEKWLGWPNPGHIPARLVLDGDRDKTLFTSGIINGSFEDSSSIGDSAWKYQGDARILTKLAELVPAEGNNMAIITTGIGSKEPIYKKGTEGSYIYQYFKVPAGANTIHFSYDIVSEEPMEWVGTQFDDRFMAELVDEKGTVLQMLAEESINQSTWYSIDGIDFEGGDHTTYHTNWKDINFDISGYQGQYVAIRFSVCDLGDSIYDTAALIDNVYLNE